MGSRFGVALALLLALARCGGKASTVDEAASERPTLDPCERDAQCTEGKCICGHCTRSCESNDDCSNWLDGSCLPASRVGCTREGLLCLPEDAESSAPDGPGSGSSPSASAPDLIDEPTDDDAPVEPDPEPSAPTVELSACRTLAGSDAGLATESPFVDESLRWVEGVAAKTAALTHEAGTVFAELAEQLEASDATPESLVSAYHALRGEGPEFSLLMWAAHCPVSVGGVLDAALRCDPELAAGEALDCQGVCLGPQGSPCSGSNECWVEATAECAGPCEGSCDVPLSVAGNCDGACAGTCVLTDATECEAGVGACRSQAEASVACNGDCEGLLSAPAAIAGCGEVARAAVWLETPCTATTPVPLYPIEPDAGAPPPASSLDAVLVLTARVLELNESATLALQAASVLNATLADVEAAADAARDETGCAAPLVEEAAVTLGTAGSELGGVLADTSTFIAGL